MAIQRALAFGRVVGREDRRLRGQIARWHALGRLVEDDEILAGLRIRPVEDGGEHLVVARREAVETEMVPARDVGPALGIWSVGIRGAGNIFISCAPVRCSIARAYAT